MPARRPGVASAGWRSAQRLRAHVMGFKHRNAMTFSNRTGKKVCGAQTRKGEPCQWGLLLQGGRCRCHGGLSTGPRTREGLQRSIRAMHGARHTPEGVQVHRDRMRALWADPHYRLKVITSRFRAQFEKDFRRLQSDRYNPATWRWFDARQARRRARLLELQREAATPPLHRNDGAASAGG
jgi:hypothetical protein